MKLLNMKTKLRSFYIRAYNASFFKLVMLIKRKLAKKLSFIRPASYPYITGDGFRSLAQHIHDDISDVNASKISDGDIVFVRGDMLKKFFEKIHSKINAKYILISQNADNNIHKEFDKYINEKVIHWFSQNLLFDNKKVSPIPIGLVNSRYSADIQIIKKIQLKSYNKKSKIVLSFNTHMGRLVIKNKLEKLLFTEDLPPTDKFNYYEKIASYKFVASPEGNGIDCHRTWEAMHLKCVPIVLRNTTTAFFEQIGLPILTIENWDEVEKFDENFLENKYRELESKFSSPALYMHYWTELIFNSINLK